MQRGKYWIEIVEGEITSTLHGRTGGMTNLVKGPHGISVHSRQLADRIVFICPVNCLWTER